ncbi:helix-hairpin-helix domain-containing protein [Micromonospora sp. 15K316]|uniref:helix-hairpin-helix domain-containing protein n=1 Tax=Micromonospora sp. 15K316 TaxID=2530376 RepID=UPI001FB8333E|nr:helix-hairpin-helix domain-containing protein [Micromonospora sp. 15K316]
MAWSFGQSLTVILALLVGLAGGWFLRGRRGARKSDPATVDGAPAATTAVLAPAAPAAVTDAEQPAATIDPAPKAVADETTVPAERDDAGAAPPGGAESAATSAVDPASDVDRADMALTDGPAPVVAPRPAPEAERLDAAGASGTGEPPASTPDPETGEPGAAEPADAAAPPTETADTASFEALPFGALVPANDPEQATVDVAATSTASTDVDPTPHPRAEVTPEQGAEEAPVAAPTFAAGEAAAPAEVTPSSGPATDGPVAGEATAPVAGKAEDDERAEPPTRRSAVATPPVRPVAATSVEVDDFRRIQGVGPKMAAALQAAGVRTYQQLADLDETALRELIRGAGLRAAPGLATWPQQARLLASAPDEATAALPAPTGPGEA